MLNNKYLPNNIFVISKSVDIEDNVPKMYLKFLLYMDIIPFSHIPLSSRISTQFPLHFLLSVNICTIETLFARLLLTYYLGVAAIYWLFAS